MGNFREVKLVTLDKQARLSEMDFNFVVFLDFDGVLHPLGAKPHEEFCFLNNFVSAFRFADPNHTIPIVISSLWRHEKSLEALRSYFPLDIAEQIVGVTPFQTREEVLQIKDWSAYGGDESKKKHRQREISLWMSLYSPDGEWLAIDDQPSYFHENESRLFIVPGFGRSGMTEEVALNFFSHLQNQMGSFFHRAERHSR